MWCTYKCIYQIISVSSSNNAAIIFAILGSSFLGVCIVFLLLRIYYYRRELKAAGLENFEEGDIEKINPELPLEDQADLLPYDKSYEFPKEQLKCGKRLGSGAYGAVVKATAENISPNEKETTVAVKEAKEKRNSEVCWMEFRFTWYIRLCFFFKYLNYTGNAITCYGTENSDSSTKGNTAC